MVVGGVKEGVQGTVDFIILAGFDLDRKDGEIVIVIDQKIDLTSLLVVIVVQGESVGVEFLRHNGLIDGAEIDAALVSEHRIDVIPV